MDINEILAITPVVPLVQADDPTVAVETTRALAAGAGTVLKKNGPEKEPSHFRV